jgi:3-phenylpropionate/trans-cinnamate dioxygenase ferredoxin reductase subunit
MVAGELAEAGIGARFNARVERIEGEEGRVTAVCTADGARIPADLVTTSLGARWELDWFAAAGGRVGRGALTDEWLRTDLPDVWAAGDAADPLNPYTGARTKTFNVYTAGVQGRMAALGMLGRPRQLQRVPWYGFRVLGLFFTFIGMVDTRTPGLTDWVNADPAERRYTRVFLRDRRVVGGLLINSTVAGPVRRYAESGEPLPADPGLVFRDF